VIALIAVLAWTRALVPPNACAQAPAFVKAVSALGAATRLSGAARSDAVRSATASMREALANWDGDIRALEGRVDRELTTMSDEGAARLHVQLGLAYRARGRNSEALREFDAASVLRPSSVDLQLLRALTLQAMTKPDDAARAFTAALKVDARNPVVAYYLLRGANAAQADRERARRVVLDAYQRLRRDSTPPAAPPFPVLDGIPDGLSRVPIVADDEALASAFARLRAGKYDEALGILARADETRTLADGDSPRALLARGQEDEANGRVAAARRAYERVLGGTLAGGSVLLVAIARLAQVDGDLPRAIAAFSGAVQAAPNDANVHKEFAGAYTANGQVEDALAELVAALLIDPRDAQAHAAIGQLYLDSGRTEDAVAALERALALAPDRYEVRYALSTALRRLGRTEDAAKQLDEFERARREALTRRRQSIASDVEQQEALRPAADGTSR